MTKILVEEKFLDNLIQKALPQEYEVLAQDYALSEEEEEYFLLLLLLFSDIIRISERWIRSHKKMPSIDELDMFFFDSVKKDIDDVFKEHFLTISSLLILFFNNGKTDAFRELNATPKELINESVALSTIKHHNHQVTSNLVEDMSNNIKETIWRGVNDKLDVDEIVHNVKENAFKPRGTINRNDTSPSGKVSLTDRARMTATTERGRAYNSAKLQTYYDYGVRMVDIITMHDEKVCNICLNNEMNNPYTIEEAQKLLPSHPHCRCGVKPHFENEPYYMNNPIFDDFSVDMTTYP